ncbi:Hypothetical protein PFR_JS12-1_627 [Propionibacterium freudenreichii]|nr:hypothetical protein [Propionibacterium freudenreichii]SBN95009.1 Hypothetical protein PFR_JS12-2_625 [Propionibacterium freudenreichii]SCC96595.1 Hypothetical protein PFR_JS12-1_627 [Propionibacterium freudenreichii]
MHWLAPAPASTPAAKRTVPSPPATTTVSAPASRNCSTCARPGSAREVCRTSNRAPTSRHTACTESTMAP